MTIADVLKPKSKDQLDSIINNYIIDFKNVHLGEKWVWRKGQEEVVREVIRTYLDKSYNVVILEAPTGAGKSVISMAIAYILNKYKKTGYILTSETSLQDQYEQDIKKFNLNWGSIKGVDHYMCIDNNEKYSFGTCKIRNKTPKTMGCYNECPYLQARELAMMSETSIMNYNYWLIMQNFVNSKSDDNVKIFPSRDFTISDEAHKILDIIQQHYSPRFTDNTIEKLQKLSDFFNLHKVKDHTLDVNIVKSGIDEMWVQEDQDILYGHLCSIESALRSFKSSIEILKEKVEVQYKNKKPPKEWMESLFISDWVKDLHCKIEDYNFIIRQTSIRNLIKNPTINELTFNCLEENFLMERYFHKFTGFTILMSATFSNPKEYMKSINIKGAKYIKMDNLFNYEKSPIYYYPKRRLSYKQFEQNKDWFFDKINGILQEHKGENGIIHSASYDLTMKIRDNLSAENRKRVFVYEGTEEKSRIIDIMKMTKNSVIMGPSLRVGLNFPDDECRFSIIAKVPYPSLSDRYINTKMKINPNWYAWKTCLEIIQSLGRSIRHTDDYCKSYILDACFGDLVHCHRNYFPIEFIQRIKVIDE